MISSESEKTLEVSAKECTIQSVQVYLDRAEVTREVATSKLETGVTKFTVTHLVDSLDTNTLRVKGNKDCHILEVSQDRRVLPKVAGENHGELLKKKEEKWALEKQIVAKDQELQRVRKRLLFVEQFVDTSFKQQAAGGAARSLAEASEMIDWHQQNSNDAAASTAALQVEIADLQSQLAVVNTEIQKLTASDFDARQNSGNHGGGPHATQYQRTVTITVDCTTATAAADADAPASLPLVLSYVVKNASWTPSYDVRISAPSGNSSTSAAAAAAPAATTTTQKALQLVYFAEVKQHSGEDWTGVDLTLSTSDPSLRAYPKPLVVLKARDARAHTGYSGRNVGNIIMKKSSSKSFGGGGVVQQMSQMQAPLAAMSAPPAAPGGGGRRSRRAVPDSDSDDDDDDDDDDANEGEDGSGCVGEFGTSATVNALTTAFTIPRKCTIDSDNLPHKVVIADTMLVTEVVYYAAPCTGDVNVYLQSKTSNSSPYVFLASEKVSIFLDGAFIAVSSLKQTTPGSNFYLYLGPDKSIKCNRKPVKDTSASSVGGIFASSMKIKECSFITVLHNTNGAAAATAGAGASKKILPTKILIADVLPKTDDNTGGDKIVVDLVEPSKASKKFPLIDISGAFSAENGMASVTSKDLNRAEDCVYKEKDGNTLLWMVHLAPGAKKSLDFHYRVTCPPDVTVEIA